jgi:hypothetical protein
MKTTLVTFGAVAALAGASLAFGQTTTTTTSTSAPDATYATPPPPPPLYQGTYSGQAVNADGNVVAQPSTPAPAPQTVYVQQQQPTVVYTGSPYYYSPYYYPYYVGPTVVVGGGWGWRGGWGYRGGWGWRGGWRR